MNIVGRNLTFDRDEALEKTMRLFWENGYHGTSVQNIIDEIGIKPGSFYNTFNDKYSVFIESLNLYGSHVLEYSKNTLVNERTCKENLTKFFGDMATVPDFKSKGCLIIKTIVEVAPKDKNVLKIVNNILTELKSYFYECLKKGQETGEVSKNKDIKALSSFYASATDGLVLSGKTKIKKDEMNNIVKVIVSTMD